MHIFPDVKIVLRCSGEHESLSGLTGLLTWMCKLKCNCEVLACLDSLVSKMSGGRLNKVQLGWGAFFYLLTLTASYQVIPQGVYAELKQLKHAANHTLWSCIKVKNRWSVTSVSSVHFHASVFDCTYHSTFRCHCSHKEIFWCIFCCIFYTT